MEDVKVQALKAREGKPQHMEAGKVYAVNPDTALQLVVNGQAVEAKDSMKVGKVYALPELKDADLLGGGDPDSKKKTHK